MNKKNITGELSRHRNWVLYLLILLTAAGCAVGYILFGDYGVETVIVVISVVMFFFIIGQSVYVAFTADDQCVMFTEPKGRTTTVFYKDMSGLHTHSWTTSREGGKVLHVYVRFTAGGRKYKFYTEKGFDHNEVKHDDLRYNRLVNETDAKRLYDHIREMTGNGHYQG